MMGVSRPWRGTEPKRVLVERSMSPPKRQSSFVLPLECFTEKLLSPGISAEEEQDEWDRQDELVDDGSMIIKLPMIARRNNSDPGNPVSSSIGSDTFKSRARKMSESDISAKTTV